MANVIIAKEIFSKYKAWVRANPEKASDFETAFKWTSYFLAGRINNAMIPTETVYAASNLLVFLNDRLIQSASPSCSGPSHQIRVWLTVLEYLEVLIEISSSRFWGVKTKWLVVGAIQILKCGLRLALLLKYKERLVSSPAVPPLKRSQSSSRCSTSNGDSSTISSVAFKLKRSGRVIRKVEASPINGSRLWRPPVVAEEDESDEELDRQALTKHLTGEVLYITKPLAQLACTYRYGETSWKPWLLAFGMDLTSLLLLSTGKRRSVSQEEKLELSRRMMLLLLYVLRSPFYERHSKDRVNAFLEALSETVPLARYISDPAKLYIPYFQSTYSYVWST